MSLDDMPPTVLGRLLGRADSPGYADDLTRRLGALWAAESGRLLTLRGARGQDRLTRWVASRVRACEPRFARVAARPDGPGFHVRGRLGDGRVVAFRVALGPASDVCVEDA
ncbi:MAG TPA: hypothetical protein VKE74_30835 [Gemmataceae bacterium]|nr:hypothetical protein [Gemmataceae bacterium]